MVHDHELISNSHRLELILGDMYGRGSKSLVQQFQLGAHLVAQARVEVRDRLGEEEKIGLLGQGATESDALLLAAAQSRDPLVNDRIQVQEAYCRTDATSNFVLCIKVLVPWARSGKARFCLINAALSITRLQKGRFATHADE